MIELPEPPRGDVRIEVCEAQNGRSIVVLLDREKRVPRSLTTLFALTEAAANAAIMGAFAETVDFALVSHAEIQFLGMHRDADAATATLVESIDEIFGRLRNGRRTEVNVRVVLGDRNGTRMVTGAVRYVVGLRRARRADTEQRITLRRITQSDLHS